MLIQRLTGVAALASMLLLAVPAQAANRDAVSAPLLAGHASSSVLAMNKLPILSPAPILVDSRASGLDGDLPAFVAGKQLTTTPAGEAPVAATKPAVADPAEALTDLRKSLIALAMHLQDVRYRRGGRSPVTGFDCSGFVRYVFAHAIGVQLPANSASQFLAGLKVKRADMKPGDLVFFHTAGRHGRISHVGIYISDGRFIHAPASGKNVQISSLDEAYWAKRFVGAKRPEGMLTLAGHDG